MEVLKKAADHADVNKCVAATDDMEIQTQTDLENLLEKPDVLKWLQQVI